MTFALRRLLFLFALLPATATVAQSRQLDSLKRLLKTEMVDTGRVWLLINIADAYRQVDHREALSYVGKAEQLAGSIEYPRGLGKAYMTRANIIGDKTDYVEELRWNEKAEAVFRAARDTQYMAKAISNIAGVHFYTGDYEEGMRRCLEALGFSERVGDDFGVSVCYMTMGNIAMSQRDFRQSISHYSNALEINRRSRKPHPALEPQLLANIGNGYNLLGEYDKAIEYYNLAVPYFEKTNALREQAVCLNNIGELYRSKGELGKAESFYRQSLALKEKLGDREGMASTYDNIGQLFLERRQLDSALHYGEKSLNLSLLTGAKPQQLKAYLSMSEIMAAAGKYKEAYAYQQKYMALNDSVLGAEKNEAIEELKARYNSVKSAQKIEELERNKELDALRDQRKNGWIAAISAIAALLTVLAVLILRRYLVKSSMNKLLSQKNFEITQQKDAITLQKNEITDSINYARRIQESILPPEQIFRDLLPGSFILYAPKDIVSGDFYWIGESGGQVLFAAVDCTGHGVPGAMMSVVGFNLLEQAVNERGLSKPSEILRHLDWGVNKLLRQSESAGAVKDGMDLALCAYDPATKQLQYAGAFNPLYHLRNGELREIKADKSPIGVNVDGIVDEYTNHVIQLEPGDCVYIFSDGYADQFGGPYGKKFKYTQLRELLKTIWTLPPAEQRRKLERAFIEWRKDNFQVDDVLVIGVKI